MDWYMVVEWVYGGGSGVLHGVAVGVGVDPWGGVGTEGSGHLNFEYNLYFCKQTVPL